MKIKRNKKIVELRNKGLTFQEIANIYGISRQRAHKIFTNKSYPQVSGS